MQKWQEGQTAAHGDWSVALRREAVIRPLAEQVRLRESMVDEAADQLGVGRTWKGVAASEVTNALVLDVIERGLEERPCILGRIIRSEILLLQYIPDKNAVRE